MKLTSIQTGTLLKFNVPASKSISNRLLVLRHLYFPEMHITNLSDSNDTLVMQKLLSEIDQANMLDVQDAGTAARFILAVAAVQSVGVIIRGTARMHQRPMGPLINALKSIGSHIECLENEGHLPVKVTKGISKIDHLEVPSNESSQFFSALMMIAPALNQKIQLKTGDNALSRPYISMTGALMRELGMTIFEIDGGYTIESHAADPEMIHMVVENDWSSAAFLLEWLAFREIGTKVEIHGLSPFGISMQGDSILMKWAEWLGCEVLVENNGLTFVKSHSSIKLPKIIDFSDHPDLALPLITAWAALGCTFNISGVESLKHKESDRMRALETELAKCGVTFSQHDSFITIDGSAFSLKSGTVFSTYDDHRMAMSLAILAHFGDIEIENPDCVKKSFPSFWLELRQLGLKSE